MSHPGPAPYFYKSPEAQAAGLGSPCCGPLCQLLRWLRGIGCVPRGILWQLGASRIAVSPQRGGEFSERRTWMFYISFFILNSRGSSGVTGLPRDFSFFFFGVVAWKKPHSLPARWLLTLTPPKKEPHVHLVPTPGFFPEPLPCLKENSQLWEVEENMGKAALGACDCPVDD